MSAATKWRIALGATVILVAAVVSATWFVTTPTYSLYRAKLAYRDGNYQELRRYFDVEAVAKSVGGFQPAPSGSDLATSDDLNWLSDFSTSDAEVEHDTALVTVENEVMTARLRMIKRGRRWCAVEMHDQNWHWPAIWYGANLIHLSDPAVIFLQGAVVTAIVVILVKLRRRRRSHPLPRIVD